jgi:hypothetical protein
MSLDDVADAFVLFDLRQTYWYDLGALLWLIALLNRLKRNGNELQLLLPEPDDSKSTNVWHFLNRWRFFDVLRQCVDDPVNLLTASQVRHMLTPTKYAMQIRPDQYGQETMLHSLRLLEITAIDALKADAITVSGDPVEAFVQRYHETIVTEALSGLCGWDAAKTKRFVKQVIEEGVRNAFLHGRGSFVWVSMRVDSKNLSLAICDNGVGIPQVLRNAFKQLGGQDVGKMTDVDLIRLYTEPDLILDSTLIELSTRRGTTSRPHSEGMGLYYLKSLVLGEGGRLRIRSGTASVDFTDSGVENVDQLLTSPGSLFAIITPLKTSTT